MLYHNPLWQTLAALQPALAITQRRWWILGSAAVLLHGGDPGEMRDLDLLLDPADFAPVMTRLGLVPAAGSGDGQFRSAWFNRWDGGALPVELFADFWLCEAGRWHACKPVTQTMVSYFGQRVWVPEKTELCAILYRFGRPKDLARAAALAQVAGFHPDQEASERQ
jgi:hypothetical protein